MAAPASSTAAREPARTAAPAAQPAAAAGKIISVAGIRLYKMRTGQLIELPPDITSEQAAQMEAEGAAAEKRLGRRPVPGPVPQVRKPAKEAKPEAPKHPPKRRPSARGAAAAKAAKAAAAALLGAVGTSKVAQYLASKALPVLARGSASLSRLAQHEQTHHDAHEKLAQSEDAVVIPKSEEQSTGNAGQVETVGGRPAPVVEPKKAEGRLTESIQENIPKTLEDVDNFRKDQRGRHMSADVLEVVQGDKNSVVATFGDVRTTPPPVPSGHVAVDLPPTEAAPHTPPMNLGKGAVAPLEKEHTDTSSYTNQADAKLKEEGVTQEQLDMVDSGELADANKEKKGLEQKAKTEPAAIQDFARQETARVDRGLVQEEKAGRDAMGAKRRAALAATGHRQHGTKSALEKQRDDVAAQINGMYKKAQDSVTKKLADLERDSMKRFDEGNAKAAKTFEDTVNREFEAYKADRYSGWFGWARKAKDWLLGMDELPRVKEIFDTNRAIFVETVNQLVAAITADNKRVIQQCKDELADARKQIADFVKGLKPALQGIGKKAAAEMSEKLADLDNKVGAKEEELRGKLKDKQTAAIRAIDDKITKMKEAMSGALAKLGRLLLYAAKKFFSWALGKFGVSLSTIEGIIDKGIAVLKAIFTGPIKFVKNLVGAAGLGFENFGKHFLTHLKNAVFEWLTGSLEGITLPETWNLRGILSVVLQIAGITWENLRKHLLKYIPEPVLKGLETGFALVKTLVTEGPMAAWEQLKSIGAELTDAFVDAVKNWIKWKIVQKAIETILSMFIPGAGIIRAIIGIYDTIVFFIQKAKQIMEMIGNFLGSIADIAAGNIGAAAQALEDGLANGLKLVIQFLAKFLHLDGITAKIREVIGGIRNKVDGVLDKVASWVAGLAKKAGRFVASKALGGDPKATPEQRLQAGVGEGVQAVNRLGGREIGITLINPVLAAIRLRHNLKSLQAQPSGGVWSVVGEVNPKLAALTEKAVLTDKKTPGATKREYGSLTGGGFGTWGRVTGLHKLGAENPPSVDNAKHWQALSRRLFRRGGSTYYVRGHLINGKFGGPGDDWHNLTPLTQASNNRSIASMLHTFENPVKQAVESNGTVDVDVRAVYKQPDRSGDIAKVLGKRPSAEDKAIAGIIEAEQHVPSQIVATAHIVSGGGGAKDPVSTTENVVDTNLDNYFHADYPSAGGAARRLVNLNKATQSELKELVGVTDAVATAIIRRRRYSDRDGLIAAMDDDQVVKVTHMSGAQVWHNMMSTAGVKLVFE